jgi:hypothetical protein
MLPRLEVSLASSAGWLARTRRNRVSQLVLHDLAASVWELTTFGGGECDLRRHRQAHPHAPDRHQPAEICELTRRAGLQLCNGFLLSKNRSTTAIRGKRWVP